MNMNSKINLEQLKQQFKNPSIEYRPAPFWFWNSKLDKSELERQIKLMYEAGLGGFFMHARFGLETGYMSDEWLDCVKHSVSVAKALGMKAWLYDEYPFPSGVGGLEVTSIPQHRNKFIDLFEWQVEGGEVELSLSRAEEHAKTISAFAVFAVPEGDEFFSSLESLRESAVSLTLNGDILRGHLPEGKWRVSAFVNRVLDDPRGNFFGPDYLNINMTQSFLNILEKYTSVVGEEFGKTIPGIFTDEPCLLTWHQNHTCYRVHHDGKLVVWNDELERRLREELEKLDYGLEELVAALFYDLGDEGRILRQLYREKVAQLYIEAFFKPYSDWCAEKGLKLTGHLLLEEGLYSNTIFQGDFVKDLSLFDIPGTDHLGIDCEGKYGGWGNLPFMSTNVQGQKLVSSIAHLYGKESVISESFGVSGWGLTMADMKRIVDWQFRLGVNFFCPHAFYYSTEGFRKNDSPPSQFFQATYWRYYRIFADYVAKLSLMLRAGVHKAKVALFYPLRDFWGEFKAGVESVADKLTSDYFNFYATELLKCHYDYDIVPEEFFIIGNVKNGKLCVGKESYEVAVIPPVSELSKGMRDALVKFYREGGRILMSEIPAEFINQLNFLNADGKVVALPLNLTFDALKQELAKILRELSIPDITISSCEVGYIHRTLEDTEIFFLASDSNQPLEVKVEIPYDGSLEHWNAETGKISEVIADCFDGKVKFMWSFEPFGSALFVLKKNAKSQRETEASIVSSEKFGIRNCFLNSEIRNPNSEFLSGEWEFETESPNVLPLNDWNLSMKFSGDWGNYDFTTKVIIEEAPESLLLLLDDVESRLSFMEGMFFQIFINDTQVKNREFGCYIDPKWKTVEIGDLVRKGENKIMLRFVNQSWAGDPKVLVATPKLLGRFALRKVDESIACGLNHREAGSLPFVIVSEPKFMPTGSSWTEHGYPFYSGTAVYSRNLNIKDTSVPIFIEANEVGDMVEFILNGTATTVRPWKPFVAKLNGNLNEGENKLQLKVTNSMKNFIESVPKPSGLLGEVKLLKHF
jgi:hypothetical protein